MYLDQEVLRRKKTKTAFILMGSWKDHNAIQRIFNVFQKNKDRVYPQDIEALKHLNEIVEANAKETAVDNILFSKLLCCMMRYHIQYYGNIRDAKMQMAHDLKTNMDVHLFSLTKALNEADKISFLNTINQEDVNQNQQSIIDKLNSNWSLSNVSKSFYKTCNDFIKDIENYG